MHSAQAASAARLGQTGRGTPSFNPSMCGSCTRMSLPDAVGDTRWVSVGVCLTVVAPGLDIDLSRIRIGAKYEIDLGFFDTDTGLPDCTHF